MELLEGERVLAFDLETTGVSTSRDRIVQLALIGSNSDGTEISYDQLVNPRRSIPTNLNAYTVFRMLTYEVNLILQKLLAVYPS